MFIYIYIEPKNLSATASTTDEISQKPLRAAVTPLMIVLLTLSTATDPGFPAPAGDSALQRGRFPSGSSSDPMHKEIESWHP